MHNLIISYLTFISTTGVGWVALLCADGPYEKTIVYSLAILFTFVMSDNINFEPVKSSIDIEIKK